MKNRKLHVSLRWILILVPFIVMALLVKPSESADFSTYCQYPPYVYQSKLPSVMLLVSNSYSMSGFAYVKTKADTEDNADFSYNRDVKYYGLFNPDYWYDSNWRITTTKTTTPKGGNTNWWSGSFLNWLTMRRFDIVNKLLTGGVDLGKYSTGYRSCGYDNTLYKTFTNEPDAGVNLTDKKIYVKFDHNDAPCTGKNLSHANFYYYVDADRYDLNSKNGMTQYSVIGDPPSLDGVIQRNMAKAQIGVAFYNEKGDGANIAVPVRKTGWDPKSDYNVFKTPSQYNGLNDQPLANALFSIAGYFAQVNSNSLVSDTCTVVSECGPYYSEGQANTIPIGSSNDPYYQQGALSTCTHGYVIILTDGEPCSDGNLPGKLAHYAEGKSPFYCSTGADNTCSAVPSALQSEFHSQTTIPACTPQNYRVTQSGRVTGSLEDVALWAHTTDLRNDIGNSNGIQNLDIWVVKAFGNAQSNLLKYAAINGSFDRSAGSWPSESLANYSVSGPSSSYYESADPYYISSAIDNIFQQLLTRATSGTAASVLASGEGSGANLVQAVFYPQRRFFDQVIQWTGTLQNFWYYIDPYYGNSSIREDSQTNNKLDLQLDNTVSFYFDTDNQVTRVKSFGNDATGKPNTGPIIKSFDEVKSLWEAGKFLYVLPPVDRRIFTVINEYNTTIVPGVGSTAFTTGNTSGSFRNKLGVTGGSGSEDNVINYVRGLDSPAFRNRTVQYPNFDSPDNVWKLGDIINSTPRVVASVPLNTYDQVNRDYTYKLFINGTNRNTYKDRGMVFVGANDGMLHAFKLGKLTFPTGNNLIKAQLEGTELGSEQWAFIPKNALPYLQALQDNNYCHLYYVDQAPQVFDASIAAGSVASTSTTPRDESHWATILIGGMRLGGACRTSAVTCTSSDNCVASPVSDGGLSSYFAMDVTDPTSPKVLWEFPDKDRTDYSYPPSSSPLGFATTGPAIVRINDGGDGTKGKWFAVFGSGPTGPIQSRQFLAHSDQPLRLFIVDLITGKLVRTIEQYGPPGAQAPISSAFAGSMINSTADFNQDYSDDVLYIGYVQKNGTTNLWNNGGVIRLQTNGSINPDNWLASKVIENIGPVTSSVVHLQNNDTNKNWLFFGAGRYYFALPDSPDDDIAQRRLYGIQDTCFNKPSNNSYVDNCSNIVTIADLTPRTTASNDAIANLGWYINLDPPTYIGGYLDNQAERVITDPLATTAGVVFFTTFRPYGAACAIGGKTFLWAVQYDTGGDPFYTAQGAALMNQMKAMMQVSTASVEQLDKTYFSGDASHRKSFAMEGVPPMAQGLSLLVPPPPVKRILHMIER